MCDKLRNRKLHKFGKIFQRHIVQFGISHLSRGLVVIAQEPFIIRRVSFHDAAQQLLRKYDCRAQAFAVERMIAFADAIEAVAGCDYPHIRCRAPAVAPIVLKKGWVLWRNRGEVIERFITSRSQAGICFGVTKYSAIDDLGVKRGLRSQLVDKSRDVLLTLRCKGFFVARTTAKRYYNCFRRIW